MIKSRIRLPRTRAEWEELAWAALIGAGPLVALGWIFALYNEGTM